MEIQVTLTTQVKAAVGEDVVSVVVDDGASVMDAIHKLATLHPEAFDRYVLTNGQLLPSILLSLNDNQVDSTAVLADGDQLLLLSAISGG